jgi:Spy/CpxP family protein refolding chaperone
MKTKLQSLKQLLAIASLVVLPAMAVQAAHDEGRRCQHGGEMGGHGGPMMHGDDMMGTVPSFLHSLNLTDEQRDAIFNITYKQAPAMRDNEKSLRKAHEALHALAKSGKFDEARAKSLAQDIAENLGAITLMRARIESDIYAVLTPEQRKKIDEARDKDDFHPVRGPHDKSHPEVRAM